MQSLPLSQSSKGSWSWEYRVGYISLLSDFVEIEKRLYSAVTKYESDPTTNVFIVLTKWD